MTVHRIDGTFLDLQDGDVIALKYSEYLIVKRAPSYAQRDNDERLTRLAEKAFQLGLQNGRAIVRPITREALCDRLGLVVVERRRPLAANEVTFEELNALRVTYGAAHKASATVSGRLPDRQHPGYPR